MKIIFFKVIFFFAGLQFAVAQVIDDSYLRDSVEIVTVARTQETDIRRPIFNVIWSQFDQERIRSAPENFLAFMVFGIEINSEGRINAFYTNSELPSEFTDLMIAPAKLSEAIKKLDYNFKGYENKILMFPLLMKKLSSEKPGKDMRIIDDIIKMWPALPPNNSLPILLLKPFFAPFSYHIN